MSLNGRLLRDPTATSTGSSSKQHALSWIHTWVRPSPSLEGEDEINKKFNPKKATRNDKRSGKT